MIENLACIGHIGNFIHLKDMDKQTSSASSGTRALYSDAFHFEGVNELLSDPGVFALHGSEMSNIDASITGLADNSHNLKMLTFNVGSIFSVGQTGFLPNLENLSIMKYLDIGSTMSGFKMPAPIHIPILSPSKKR